MIDELDALVPVSKAAPVKLPDEKALFAPVPKAPSKRAYRHELKYFVGDAQAALLSERLLTTMDLDENVGPDREYEIRSLYFDDLFETAVAQKIAGDDIRKKYRLRIYNMRDDVIKLECKEKTGAFIYKRSIQLDRAICDAVLGGDARAILQIDHPLAREFYQKTVAEGLHPVVIVDYAREAYVAPYQDVRITLDKRLHTGYWDCNLFDKDAPMLPALLGGETIVEVKFNQHLPEYYRYLLQGIAVQRSAASKYVLCRQFE